MIGGVAKVLSIAIVGYCATDGMKNAGEQIKTITALPKRVMTVFELKQIHRLILYELVGESAAKIQMKDFCEKNLEAAGRDPGKDYWETPYRMFYDGSLYDENSSVTMGDQDSDKYVVVSAGLDKQFRSKDDLTSRNDTDEEVRELQKQIDAEIKKQEEREKKSKEKQKGS